MKVFFDQFVVNSKYIDFLYQKYSKNPESVDPSWYPLFDALYAGVGQAVACEDGDGGEWKVREMIQRYREWGHLLSKTNPVRSRPQHMVPLALEDVALCADDLHKRFEVASQIGLENATLLEIVQRLNELYCGAIGFEYQYVRDPRVTSWFQHKIEREMPHFQVPQEHKARILKKLNQATLFEQFIHTKYIGQKRFSLEGGENLIPMLDSLIHKASGLSVRNVVIGMAHRGRLNVLTNIVGKRYEAIFQEFDGVLPAEGSIGDGDVKYHMGFTGMFPTKHGEVLVELLPNPSHLEAVNPVVIGYTQAKASSFFQSDCTRVLPILIHGDSALTGQGIGYELAQMSRVKHYDVGGVIHIVVNNQLGFTTNYTEARSSLYCTDIAKLTEAPVLHVNGDDAEAVVFAVELAVEFRQFFGQDIFIDMLCYRKYGHNESDEPRFTQPTFYRLIDKHLDPREIYAQKLLEEGSIDAGRVEAMEKECVAVLQEQFDSAKEKPLAKTQHFHGVWEKLRFSKAEDFLSSPDTSVSEDMVLRVAKALISTPEGFTPIRQIQTLLKDRREMFFESKIVNWASAELLAYGTLLLEGYGVRVCGQDSERGTFSHRHAVIHDAETSDAYCSLVHMEGRRGAFQIFNSILSEYGVLGVQYGYALADPMALVVWEAQFGDFANGAQVMMDQFISSGESKWQKTVGLVLLLPHGYEGQGPEHSSARLERFLQMCAEDNMIVANITTPANLFHVLRRQMKWAFRKPLVVMSPKSLLRHPRVVSPLSECLQGSFREIIDDSISPKSVTKVLLCTGKIYYELLEEREQNKQHVAIIRIEQLYPFPMKQFEAIIKRYPSVPLYWVQEEPLNMGAGLYLMRTLKHYALELISRKESASPAVGYAKLYKQTQNDIIKQAFESNKTRN